MTRSQLLAPAALEELLAIAARNKDNYLKAKAAFNAKDMASCMQYYAPDHQIMSRQAEKGRHEIERFLAGMHETWGDVQVNVEHAVAEGDWVMGRSKSTATHSRTVLGAAPTNKTVEITFWDLHRFNEDGLILETWNLTDNLAVMQQLGLMSDRKA
jgi:predicted ester cyclase